MNDEFIPTLTHATERDIDLLLVEELYASPSFTSWMASRAGLSCAIAGSTVLHSKRRTRSRREIDIFVDLRHPDGTRSALLIENKLDASEQPDQAESYREEMDRIADDYAAARMAIVCPSDYDRQCRIFTGKFDAVITYESLAGYFAQVSHTLSGEAAARLRFRHDILQQAIHKHRRGYTAIPNEIIGDFNAQYVALLAEVMPAIVPGKSMLKPANPDESTSMIFDAAASLAALPDDLRPTRFAHELGRGKAHRANYVAVTFGGWGAALQMIKSHLEEDAAAIGATFSAKPPTKTRPNPGLVMACPTLAVDNMGDFTAQTDLIVAGIERAGELRSWLLTNTATLRKWKALVDEQKVYA